MRSETENKQLNFGLSPEFRLTNHRGTHHCSLHSVIINIIADISIFLCLVMNKRRNEVIFVRQNLISNGLTYLVHAKSTGELISFGCSDRSVWSSVAAKRSANCWDQTKNDFTFWLIFGLSPNLGLSKSLSERLIQKVKWPNVQQHKVNVIISCFVAFPAAEILLFLYVCNFVCNHATLPHNCYGCCYKTFITVSRKWLLRWWHYCILGIIGIIQASVEIQLQLCSEWSRLENKFIKLSSVN